MEQVPTLCFSSLLGHTLPPPLSHPADLHRSTAFSTRYLEVVVELLLVRAHAVPVRPLSIGVDVHLDDAVGEGLLNLLLLRARTAVEHKEYGLHGVGSGCGRKKREEGGVGSVSTHSSSKAKNGIHTKGTVAASHCHGYAVARMGTSNADIKRTFSSLVSSCLRT